jgi:hypothetical protein
MPIGWMKAATVQANKPKYSIISLLKKKFAVTIEGRDRSVVHASDITKPNFCPRQWAFLDMSKVKALPEHHSLAMGVTYTMGLVTERVFIEDWLGSSAIGNWQCRRCGNQKTMCGKPLNGCGLSTDCLWMYNQMVVVDPAYNTSGAIDCIIDLGAPLWVVTEIKTLNPDDFEKMVVPQPEHRLRTALYLKILSTSVYKDKINLLEARVIYISRGYGKKNLQWDEIMPFKEFVVERDDASIKDSLQKAKALKMFREEGVMPSGICATAIDKYAKNCTMCSACFSGQYPAQFKWEVLVVE